MRRSAAVLLGVAMAGSANADVTLYGLAAVVVTSQDTETASGESDSDVQINVNPGLQLNSGGAASSRFGVRGVEDLGGGRSASFKFEGGVGVDGGTFEGFDRNAWVGLGSDYGELRGGLQWTPYDDAYFEIDAQEYASWSAQYLVFNNTKELGSIGSHGDTFSRENSLTYSSPRLNGFGASLMYAVGEDRSDDISGSSDYQGVRLFYLNGPVNIQFAAERQELVDSGSASIDAYLVGGAFDLGFAKFFGGYQSADSRIGHDEGLSVGVQVTLGPHVQLMSGYAREETTEAGDGVNNGVVEGVSGNVNYRFSDSTDVFLLAAGATGSVDDASDDFRYTEYGFGLRKLF